MGSSWDDIYGPASFKKIRYDIWPLPRQQSKNVIKSHVDLQQETLLCQNDDIWFILDAEGSAQRVVLIENCCNIQYFAWTYLSSKLLYCIQTSSHPRKIDVMWIKKLQSPLEKYNILLPINQSINQ